jgi:enoyl-CoA hydratase/carnithine racemase
MTSATNAEAKPTGRVRLAVVDRIATLTITRPEVRNAIDRDTAQDIAAALDTLACRDDCGALIITGAGDRAFVAGADLREMRQWGVDDALAARSSKLFQAIERLPMPTIAAINGAAAGGGCELALACDMRIAADHATFSQPELKIGVIPAAGATQRLPRIIGLGRAMHMVLTGEAIDAATALSWGLVTAVAPRDELMTRAHALAESLIARGPLAMRLARLALHASYRVDLESGLLVETLAQAICFQSPDKTEGTTAFLEKRAPKFRV